MFYSMRSVKGPEEWKRSVGKGKWRKGKSAYELSKTWLEAGGFPPSVLDVLRKHIDLGGIEIQRAVIECPITLESQRAPSMTDIMAYCRLGENAGVFAIEGKAGEGFGLDVNTWLRNSKKGSTRAARLDFICRTIECDAKKVLSRSYQLLHRTASAILEASRSNAAISGLIIHAFEGCRETHWHEYRAFLLSLGVGEPICKNTTIGPKKLNNNNQSRRGGIYLYFSWVDEGSYTSRGMD